MPTATSSEQNRAVRRHCVAAFGNSVHWLYFAVAAPLVFCSAVVVPPFRVPDEQGHFFRAVHLASGGVLERIRDGIVGGEIDPAAVEFERIFNASNPGPVPHRDWERAVALKWQKQTVWFPIAGTTRYPPILYVPQALGVLLGRIVRLSVFYSFYLGRILNGLFGVLTTTVAIAIAKRGKLLLFTICLVPMAIFLFGSMSQESGIIGLGALVGALTSRAGSREARRYIQLSIAVTVLAAARLPLVGLLPLLWLPRWRRNEAVALQRQLIASTCCICCVIGWLALTIGFQGRVKMGPAAVTHAQLAALLRHPSEFLFVPFRTVFTMYADWYYTFVGRLGWLDIPLPDFVYITSALAIALGLAAAVIERSHHTIADKAYIASAAIAVFVLLLTTMYLTWSPVGSPIVIGIQGRYFFAIAPLLPLLLPSITRSVRLTAVSNLTIAILVLFALASNGVALLELRWHFRLAAIPLAGVLT